MGFFSGSKQRLIFTKFQTRLPQVLKSRSLGGAGEAIDFFREQGNRGETDSEAFLFNKSREDTRKQFERFGSNLSLNLNRKGLSSSGSARRQTNALANAFLTQLLTADAQRSQQLLANRTTGFQNLIGGAIAPLASLGQTNTLTSSPGFGRQLGGALVSGLGGALTGGIGGAIGSGIGGLFGGGAASGAIGGATAGGNLPF